MTLPGVGGVILEDFDGDDVIGALLPALDHLAERAPPQELEHLVLSRQRVEHLVLDQLVVPVRSAAPALGGIVGPTPEGRLAMGHRSRHCGGGCGVAHHLAAAAAAL